MARLMLYPKEAPDNFHWWRWLERFGFFFEERFGADWRKREEVFLEHW